MPHHTHTDLILYNPQGHNLLTSLFCFIRAKDYLTNFPSEFHWPWTHTPASAALAQSRIPQGQGGSCDELLKAARFQFWTRARLAWSHSEPFWWPQLVQWRALLYRPFHSLLIQSGCFQRSCWCISWARRMRTILPLSAVAHLHCLCRLKPKKLGEKEIKKLCQPTELNKYMYRWNYLHK